MASNLSQEKKMSYAAELLRRGATLLKEACPKCRAVQVRFEGEVYCTNEDDLRSLVQPERERSSRPKPKTAPKQTEGADSDRDVLKDLLEEKLKTVSRQLESSHDPDEQTKLLDLVSKYVETLDRLKRSAHS